MTFPPNPSIGDTVSNDAGQTWQWDGYAWNKLISSVQNQPFAVFWLLSGHVTHTVEPLPTTVITDDMFNQVTYV